MNKNFVALTIAGALIAVGAVAAVSDQPTTAATVVYYACKDGAGEVDTIREGFAPTCKKSQTVVSWNNEGPQGLPGTNGIDGQDGQPGLGVRVWRDANDNVIGPAVDAGVELTIEGRRVRRAVNTELDGNGSLTALGTFFWYTNGTQSHQFAERYSPNSDCSPPHYFFNGSGAGYDPVAFDLYASGPRQGETDVLILSDDSTLVDIQCATRWYDGTPYPFVATRPVHTLVATVNLSETYPAPFTLE